MHNIELEVLQLQGARFVAIPLGQKGPQVPGWQNNPQLLSDIPADGNIGMLLGKQTGIMAIDFDGHWARKHFDEVIGPVDNLPTTVGWTSGKDGRCQLAFTVPVEFHDYLRTKKINDKTCVSGKPDGLEFRWASVQSVLPPSIHPETQKPYAWINSPCDVAVAELPDFVLTWWLNEVNPEPKAYSTEQLTFASDDELQSEVFKLLEAIKARYPSLSYDDWTVLTWSVFNTLGQTEAMTAALMSNFWPEQKRGEYAKLLTSKYSGNRKRTIGTLYHYADMKRKTTGNQMLTKLLGMVSN
jgi:hypothetical protein